MFFKEAKERADYLRREIEYHNDLYYNKSAPLISDYEFDTLLKELQEIEKVFPELQSPDSPSQKVGSDRSAIFYQHPHKYPMLSLANVYSRNDLGEFDRRVKKRAGDDVRYVCELKLDGVSISLIYSRGQFLRALTRGDGEVGDDVSANVLTIPSVPVSIASEGIPGSFIVRGEIVMEKEPFRIMNEERVREGLQPFANRRNAASGTLKLHDSTIVALRPLECYLYSLLEEETGEDSHYSKREMLPEWGFKTDGNARLCSNIDEVFQYIDYWEKERDNLPFDIDGVVVKVDSLSHQALLGSTSRIPRWAIAYKYKAEQTASRLLSVTFQVGRTGAVTPVANLEPVKLSGTTVKRASLHNADQIALHDIHYNDTLFIEKGGEIIPKITGRDLSLRVEGSEPITFPDNCPECNTQLTRDEGVAGYYCSNNKGCPPQIRGRLDHFAGRKAMDIEGLGEETIGQLVARGMVKDIADLYSLSEDKLVLLDKMGVKSAENLVKSIKKSLSMPYHKVLFGLGIRGVGERTARIVATHFPDIDTLMEAKSEELSSIRDIGTVTASFIENFFQDSDNISVIERLKMHGINMSQQEEGKYRSAEGAVLKGKTIVITGKFEEFDRDEYKRIIEEELGGRVTGSVTGSTTFILAGDSPGPSKMEKATNMGIDIYSEERFLDSFYRSVQ